MFTPIRPPVEIMSATDIARLDTAWREIISTMGVQFEHPEALAILAEAGQRVEGETVYFDADWVAGKVAEAPSSFVWEGRNTERSIPIGSGVMSFVPAYGAPFVRRAGQRATATLVDLSDLVALVQDAPELDSAGGVVCEPQDVPIEYRHLHLVRTLAVGSDKPFMAAVSSKQAAEDSVQMAEIVFQGLAGRTVMTAILNSNSPLRWDGRMTDAMLVLAKHNQAAIVMPGAMLGAMAPVTLAGGMALLLAEAFAAIALIQVVRPGAPVLLGGGLPVTDMQSGAAGFAGPEIGISLLVGGQLARHYGLPWRALGGALTTSQTLDAQAGWEAMQVMSAAFAAQADVVMHAAGWLDAGLVTGFEKVIADLDLIASLQVEYGPFIVDDDTLALDAIREVGPAGHFFGVQHTMERFRTCFHRAELASTANFDRWTRAGGLTAEQRAEEIWRNRLEAHVPPPIDETILRELDAYIARRTSELG